MSDRFYLQSVRVLKPIDFAEAKILAQRQIKNSAKTFYSDTDDYYEFRNLSASRFIQKTLIVKPLSDKVSVVYGLLKDH